LGRGKGREWVAKEEKGRGKERKGEDKRERSKRDGREGMEGSGRKGHPPEHKFWPWLLLATFF